MLVLVQANGDVFYANDEIAVKHMVMAARGCDAVKGEVLRRTAVVQASLEAHQELNRIDGCGYHNLGLAMMHASQHISIPERPALRSLRRKANAAKHRWQQPELGHAVAAGTVNDNEVAG